MDTLNLTINNSTSASATETACDSYTWSVDGQTYTSSGTYVHTTNNSGPGAGQTYNYTGSVQTYTVPAGVTSVTIEAWGAQGGDHGGGGSNLAEPCTLL